MYWENEFEGQKKVYKLTNMEDLKQVLKSIYSAGYSDSLIIQEFVPGDDSNLRVMICFSGKDKKVKLMSLAHVMIEEHTPHGLSNTAVLMNEYNKELSLMIKNFLENIGYEGLSTFDIKYDDREGKYKVLEVNLRQGRSNYYVTGAGDNLAKYVVEEYVYNKDHAFKIAENKNLWTVVPLQVAFKYVRDAKLRDEMRRIMRSRRVINPLFMRGDNMLPRLMHLYKSHLSHYMKFKKYFD
jgi:D-aspartate ligase